jgi:hypothetical protein
MSIDDFVFKVVQVDNVGGDEMDGDACLFVVVEIGAEVKILQIAGHESSIFGADYAVEHTFYSSETCGFSTDVAMEKKLPPIVHRTRRTWVFSGRSAQTTWM